MAEGKEGERERGYNRIVNNSHSKYTRSCYTNAGIISKLLLFYSCLLFYSASVGVTRTSILAMRISIYLPNQEPRYLRIVNDWHLDVITCVCH